MACNFICRLHHIISESGMKRLYAKICLLACLAIAVVALAFLCNEFFVQKMASHDSLRISMALGVLIGTMAPVAVIIYYEMQEK